MTIVSADVPMKNLENILKAIAIAKKEIPNIKLTVIGDMREDNKDLINNLNIKSNIETNSLESHLTRIRKKMSKVRTSVKIQTKSEKLLITSN